MGWWSRPGLGLALAFALASAPACSDDSSDDGPDAMAMDQDAAIGEGGSGSHHPDTGTDDDAGIPGDGGAPVECDVVAPTSCPDPVPTFADVQPIFQERCVSCHSGIPDGPWPLTTYSHVSSWAGQIRGAMLSCAMPPPDAGIEMPTEEREAILLWIRCGFRQ